MTSAEKVIRMHRAEPARAEILAVSLTVNVSVVSAGAIEYEFEDGSKVAFLGTKCFIASKASPDADTFFQTELGTIVPLR